MFSRFPGFFNDPYDFGFGGYPASQFPQRFSQPPRQQQQPHNAPRVHRTRPVARPDTSNDIPVSDKLSPNHYFLFFELPDVRESDVKVELGSRGKHLTVHGFRRRASMGMWGAPVMVKVPFETTVELPPGLDTDDIVAQFDEGVLIVRIARSREPVDDDLREVPLTPLTQSTLKNDSMKASPVLSSGRSFEACAPSFSSGAAPPAVSKEEGSVPPKSVAPVVQPPAPQQEQEEEEEDEGMNDEQMATDADEKPEEKKADEPATNGSSPSPKSEEDELPNKGHVPVLEEELSRLEQEKEERIKEMEFRKQLLEAEHALRSIEVEIDKIRAEWEEEAFEPVLGERDLSNPVVKARKTYEELLLQQLIKLDGVQTYGNEAMRQARKALVCRIQRLTDALDAYSKRDTELADIRKKNVRRDIEKHLKATSGGYDYAHDDDLLTMNALKGLRQRAAERGMSVDDGKTGEL